MPRDNSSFRQLYENPGPFNDIPEDYSPAQAASSLSESIILVVGAGGLGCEILKNLALTGFKKIHVIDMDTIDVSNLNRQFLFRAKDVGRYKSEVAAEFVRARIGDPDLSIEAHTCKIQDKPIEFYKQFGVVICGLDNIEARRWINALLVGLVDDQLNNLIPLVDGGTEGFRGQARVIMPRLSSCFECSLDMISPKETYPVCTIANTPRLPEHCIEWASQLEWPRRFPGKKFDADIPEDVETMYQLSLERAREFGIENVTKQLTLGVVKNIIPAIASTNAIIAAACTNEVFKIAIGTYPILDNYMMYSGDDSIFTYTYSHSKRPSCAVCGTQMKRIKVPRWWKLFHLIEDLSGRQDVALKNPSLATAQKNLYFRQPPFLETQTRPNLEKPVAELVAINEEIIVTDPSLPISILVVIDEFEGPLEEPSDISSLLKSQTV